MCGYFERGTLDLCGAQRPQCLRTFVELEVGLFHVSPCLLAAGKAPEVRVYHPSTAQHTHPWLLGIHVLLLASCPDPTPPQVYTKLPLPFSSLSLLICEAFIHSRRSTHKEE